MVGLVYKNAEMAQELPGKSISVNYWTHLMNIIISVLSKLTDTLNFIPKKALPDSTSNINTKPPKIVTACQGGYGVEKEKQRVCGMLSRLTLDLILFHTVDSFKYLTICNIYFSFMSATHVQ